MTADSTPQTPLQGLLISERDEQIIAAVALHDILSAEDICRLLFSPSSLSYVRARLSRLCLGQDRAHRAWLCRVVLPSVKSGRPYAYCLGVLGRRLAARAGIPIAASYRPGQTREHSHLLHELTAARVAVVAKLTPGFRLTELRLAPSIRRHPPTLRITRNGKRTTLAVSPDVFAVLTRVRDGQRFPTWIEIDRGSVPLGRVMEGLRLRLRLFADGGYTAWSGFRSVRVLYLTTAGSARRESLCRVAHEVIESEKLPELAELFFFAQASYERLYEPCPHCDGLPLFTHRRWYKPGAPDALVAALEPSLCDALEEDTHGDSRQRD